VYGLEGYTAFLDIGRDRVNDSVGSSGLPRQPRLGHARRRQTP
jgi:hypothetical protein